jgi:DNA-directed RNA polymerase specialized sigma24 family protein
LAGNDVLDRPVSRDDGAQALFERYDRRLYRYCLIRLWSPDDARDAAQATVLRAAGELERGHRPEFESAWIFHVADDVCTNRQRGLLESVGAPLDDLPADLRRVVVLRDVEKLPYQTIADRLGCSLRSVERRLFDARRRLATALDLGWAAAAVKGTLAVKVGVAVVAVAAGSTALAVGTREPNPAGQAPPSSARTAPPPHARTAPPPHAGSAPSPRTDRSVPAGDQPRAPTQDAAANAAVTPQEAPPAQQSAPRTEPQPAASERVAERPPAPTQPAVAPLVPPEPLPAAPPLADTPLPQVDVPELPAVQVPELHQPVDPPVLPLP